MVEAERSKAREVQEQEIAERRIKFAIASQDRLEQLVEKGVEILDQLSRCRPITDIMSDIPRTGPIDLQSLKIEVAGKNNFAIFLGCF